MTGWDDDGKTRPGFAVPELPTNAPLSSLPPPASARRPAHQPAAASFAPSAAPSAPPAPLEVEVVFEKNVAPESMHAWASYQIWTRNRVYALDAALRCLEVVDSETKQADPRHRLVGARLVGGQTNTPRGMELSYPFPRAGSEAVFEHAVGGKTHFSHTSTVRRVVARMRVVSVEHEAKVADAWETLTSSGGPRAGGR